jgi:hypothetical protein
LSSYLFFVIFLHKICVINAKGSSDGMFYCISEITRWISAKFGIEFCTNHCRSNLIFVFVFCLYRSTATACLVYNIILKFVIFLNDSSLCKRNGRPA